MVVAAERVFHGAPARGHVSAGSGKTCLTVLVPPPPDGSRLGLPSGLCGPENTQAFWKAGFSKALLSEDHSGGPGAPLVRGGTHDRAGTRPGTVGGTLRMLPSQSRGIPERRCPVSEPGERGGGRRLGRVRLPCVILAGLVGGYPRVGGHTPRADSVYRPACRTPGRTGVQTHTGMAVSKHSGASSPSSHTRGLAWPRTHISLACTAEYDDPGPRVPARPPPGAHAVPVLPHRPAAAAGALAQTSTAARTRGHTNADAFHV